MTPRRTAVQYRTPSRRRAREDELSRCRSFAVSYMFFHWQVVVRLSDTNISSTATRRRLQRELWCSRSATSALGLFASRDSRAHVPGASGIMYKKNVALLLSISNYAVRERGTAALFSI